ncbi:MAG TPA: hypothetical protein P5092_20290 [Ruminococcus sp.]|nr:hypothetical protein [Ruminococcus sp.]
MRFSDKYPQLFISAEEELKKQVMDRGLDYDSIKKGTENEII